MKSKLVEANKLLGINKHLVYESLTNKNIYRSISAIRDMLYYTLAYYDKNENCMYCCDDGDGKGNDEKKIMVKFRGGVCKAMCYKCFKEKIYPLLDENNLSELFSNLLTEFTRIKKIIDENDKLVTDTNLIKEI